MKSKLLEISKMEKFDSQGMHKIYDIWPQIAKEAFELDLEPIDFKNIDHIVFAGMGGSGAIGDLFSAILSQTGIHVNVVKGYLLPKTVDENTLVVAISISGNTAETMSVLERGFKSNCKKIAFSSGGKIESYSKKNGIEYRKIPEIHSPRTSFCNYVYSILNVLNSVITIQKNGISESLNELEKTSQKINSNNLTETNSSLELAEWISGIPLIYYPWGFEAVAIRFKNSFQENAKSHVIAENVIEACHNGIVSWEKPSHVQPILLEGVDDYIKTKERWRILKDYFVENNIDYKEVFSIKGNILSKLINLIYFLDYSTIYRAILSEIDPSPIKSIDYVKEKL